MAEEKNNTETTVENLTFEVKDIFFNHDTIRVGKVQATYSKNNGKLLDDMKYIMHNKDADAAYSKNSEKLLDDMKNIMHNKDTEETNSELNENPIADKNNISDNSFREVLTIVIPPNFDFAKEPFSIHNDEVKLFNYGEEHSVPSSEENVVRYNKYTGRYNSVDNNEEQSTEDFEEDLFSSEVFDLMSLVKLPDEWWILHTFSTYIICARFTDDYIMDRRVVIHADYSIQVFIHNCEIQIEEKTVSSVEDISELLWKVHKYKACGGVTDSSCTTCLGYVSETSDSSTELCKECVSKSQKIAAVTQQKEPITREEYENLQFKWKNNSRKCSRMEKQVQRLENKLALLKGSYLKSDDDSMDDDFSDFLFEEETEDSIL